MQIKKQFPIFTEYPNLIYLDNAATSQKPDLVIETLSQFYKTQNANIHRGIYDLSANATRNYENVRQQTAQYLGANSAQNIAFTKGTTEGINIVANAFFRHQTQKGDNILITAMEHHANLIPWQLLCRQTGAELRIANVLLDGTIDLQDFQEKIDENTQLTAFTHISNTLGTVNPIKELIEIAHEKNSLVLIDGAQSAGLYPINLKELNCDFFVFSTHKIFGPFGLGILYVAPEHLSKMQPHNVGGGIIQSVSFKETTFAKYPKNLEAGTSNIAAVIAWGATIDFLNQLDRTASVKHLKELATYCREKLLSLNGVSLIGTAKEHSGIVSFTIENVHPHDIATFLAAENIAVRAGHHCTQPLLKHLGVQATVRVSFSIYNSKEEVDFLSQKIKEIQQIFT